MEDTILNARLIYVNDPATVQELERGDYGWVETTIDQGLVPCTAPINGAVYRIAHNGGPLAKYLGFAVMVRVLAAKVGRVFVDLDGRMMIATELSQEALEEVAEQIADDILDMAGYVD